MTAPRLTASALPRAFRCPGSLVLPEARTSSAWATAGTDRHAEQEHAIDAGDLSTMPDKVRRLIPADATSIRAEVAVAYDVATGAGRELGVGLERAYGDLAPFEIPGTIDLLVLAPGRALVADWKGVEEVDEPAANEQTTLYALAVARAYGLDDVTVAIGYLVTGRVEYATLDVFELDTFGERLRRLHLDVAAAARRIDGGALPDVSDGAHCKYCPAQHVCPAKVALVHRMASGVELDQLALLRPLDADLARVAYDRVQAAKAMLKKIEAAIYAYASENTLDLGGGNFLGSFRKVGNEKLDGAKVYAAARDLYGRDFADAAVVISATKARIKEAAKAAAPQLGKSAAAIERSVLDEVRARGGAAREESVAVGVYDDPALAVAPARRELEGAG